MKKLLLGLWMPFCILLNTQGMAQDRHEIDSLENLLHTTATDSVRLQAYLRLTWNYLLYDLSKSREYARKGMELSLKKQDSLRVYRIYHYWGLIHRLEGNYDSSLHFFQQVVDYHTRNGHEERTVQALFNMGVVSSFLGQFHTSLNYFVRALELAEQHADRFMVADIQNSMGAIHKKLKNYQKSLDLTYSALHIFSTLEKPFQQANCLSNLGSTYAEMHQLDSALEYYHKAYELDKALDIQWGIGHQLNNLAAVHDELGEDKQAMAYAEEGLAVREKLGQKKEIAESLIRVASLHNQLGQPDKGIAYALQAKKLSQDIASKQELRDAYLTLSQAYHQTGNYQKAYQLHVEYASLRDSIVNEEIALQINDLQARYESEKKEKEIALLTQESAVQKAALARKNIVLNAFIAGCILLSALIFVMIRFYQSKIKHKALLAQKNEEINRRKIQELEQRQKLISMDAMVSGQEEERKRIAKELHDGLGSLLANVQMRFSTLQEHISKGKIEVYQQANNLLDEACDEVRKISHNMMPGALVKFGLIPAIQDICDTIERTQNIKIDFQVLGMSERVEEKIEITLYRIVQELLNNILKHARATEIIIQMSLHDGYLTLIVEDNGIGFDIEEAKAKGGLGMQSLASRVKYIDGRLDIEATPGIGTTVTIEIPVHQEVALT